jgi:hypothetical protein
MHIFQNVSALSCPVTLKLNIKCGSFLYREIWKLLLLLRNMEIDNRDITDQVCGPGTAKLCCLADISSCECR